MTKWIIYIVLAVLVVGSWGLYSASGSKVEKISKEIAELREIGDSESDEKVAELEGQKQSLEGEKTFKGILLAFLSAGLIGIFFVTMVLPALAHRFTHAVYDSAEELEGDPMHDARSLMAQGDYGGAIEAFKLAAAADPLNRLPWVEIAKIQKEHLEDGAAAAATIRHALESQEWQVNDAAYLLFRLAELYDEELNDRSSAVITLQQVIDQFPETRHSANARHKLHEWGVA